jgi:hypothetical protein
VIASSVPERRPADLVLLLYAMQLLSPNQGDTSELVGLYAKVKQIASSLEAGGIVTTRLLQSYLLLAVYELCNAMYPAAYLTIGHCARMGYAIGVHDRRHATQMFPPSISWTAVEEQRRIWWAVLILERYVNIGIGGRPFSCEEPQASDLLPQDEQSWENGEPTVSPSLAVSVSIYDHRICPFASPIQLLVHRVRVQKHRNQNPSFSLASSTRTADCSYR